jgi:pumilio RNA-binding family
MEGFVLPLSLSTYGCRSIQKVRLACDCSKTFPAQRADPSRIPSSQALEVVTSEQRNVLVSELKDNIMDCVKSSNANHVIQRIVALPEPGLDFIAAFTGQVFELSTHPYGCRVLQRCFEFLPEQKARPLLTEMHTQTRRLVLDQYGNYGPASSCRSGAVVRRKLRGLTLATVLLRSTQSSSLSSRRACPRTARASSAR